ncbi:MAG: queuosine precursor transporter [Chloroflexi bacterium]|nr:queuosine precursor transporter [Chloroflexota bacterium]
MIAKTTAPRVTGLFVLFAALFVTLLITSNIMAVKLILLQGRVLPAAIVLFPITYILGDVLTEVYGLRYARRVIWLGFLCNLVAVGGFWIGGLLPPAPFWEEKQAAYQTILGYTPRLLAASFAGYLVGELSNSIVLSRLKLVTQGRWLWMRTIGSTVVGEGVDSVAFITIAFAGTMPDSDLMELVLTQWVVKVLYETAATPLTYAVVAYVKRREGIDMYDRQVSLNPFDLFR